jgi:hypothetical protein
MVAGAAVFVVAGAVFGASALTATSPVSDPTVSSETPTTAPSEEAGDPTEGAEPVETTESEEAQDPAAANGSEGDGQNEGAGDSDGNGGETDSD